MTCALTGRARGASRNVPGSFEDACPLFPTTRPMGRAPDHDRPVGIDHLGTVRQHRAQPQASIDPISPTPRIAPAAPLP